MNVQVGDKFSQEAQFGYLVGANGGNLFGNGCNAHANYCSGTNCEISAINSKVSDLMDGQDTKAILDATISSASQIRSDVGSLTKDVYALNVQQLINQQSNQRNLDNQFCRTREFVSADGAATRAAINAFETRYLQDRIHDRDLRISKLETDLALSPLACGLAAVNSKLDSVIGCAGVRTCNQSVCGSCNPYTVPPLVGTATSTRSYNPNIPTGTV